MALLRWLTPDSVTSWSCATDDAAAATDGAAADTVTAVTIVTTAAATGSNYIAITRREKITFTADDDAGGDLM